MSTRMDIECAAALRAHGPGGGSQHPHQGEELPGKRDIGASASFPQTVQKGNFWIKTVTR